MYDNNISTFTYMYDNDIICTFTYMYDNNIICTFTFMYDNDMYTFTQVIDVSGRLLCAAEYLERENYFFTHKIR